MMDKGSGFKAAVKALGGNSSLKPKAKKTNNEQTSMMIDVDAKAAFRTNGKGQFSPYVNELILNDMRAKGWIV